MRFKLTQQEVKWLKANLYNFTTKQQFEHIMANRQENKQAQFTTFRTALYKKGLKKGTVLGWSDKEFQYVLDHYKTCGNKEIAQALSTKKRVFKPKSIEKKMRLKGVKRTAEHLDYIRKKHIKNGVYKKGNRNMWKKRGIAKEGDKRTWVSNGTPRVMIKINGKFTPYARYRFLNLHGSIQPGHKIYFKDGNPVNVGDENLIQRPAGKIEMKNYKKPIKNYLKNHKQIEPPVPESVIKLSVNLPTGIPVRLDRRTIVYVKPGTNIEAFKEQLINRARY